MQKILSFISTMSPIITIIISSLISYLIARSNARHEVNKLLLSFNREDKTQLYDNFSNLISSLSKLSENPSPENKSNAIEENSKFLTVAPKSFHPTLITISDILQDEDYDELHRLSKTLLLLYSQHISDAN